MPDYPHSHIADYALNAATDYGETFIRATFYYRKGQGYVLSLDLVEPFKTARGVLFERVFPSRGTLHVIKPAGRFSRKKQQDLLIDLGPEARRRAEKLAARYGRSLA